MQQKFLTAESFTRISEYFDGVEVPGNKLILRLDSESRDGHYIQFQLSAAHTNADHFLLEVYKQGNNEPTPFTFKLNSAAPANKTILLGLTGGEWKNKDYPPVAYKLSLVDAAGNILESATSFLWGDS